MTPNKRKLGASAATVALAAAAVVGVALPAHAGNLHAYDGSSYTLTELVNSPSAAVIDVADDRTTSVKDLTSSGFSGRNTVGLFSVEIFKFAAGGSYATLGGADNSIDHFDRV